MRNNRITLMVWYGLRYGLLLTAAGSVSAFAQDLEVAGPQLVPPTIMNEESNRSEPNWDSLQQEKMERYAELRRHLHELRSRLQPPSDSGPAMVSPEQPHNRSTPPTFVRTDSDPPQELNLSNDKTEQPDDTPDLPPTKSSGEEASVQGSRYPLCSSLFATGEYELCLTAIEEAGREELRTWQKSWLDYLTACCYRELGDTETAQRYYRRIVSDPESEWLGGEARWWLNQIRRRAELENAMRTLTTVIEQWETAVEELLDNS